ncbi:MAG: chorismate mutase [Gammaproteobacteria bacterium]|jgi:chorismate mutase-like protein
MQLTSEHTPGLGTILDKLRAQIDHVDQRLVTLLAIRKRLVEEIQRVKRCAGLPCYSPERESELMERLASAAQAKGLRSAYVREIFARVIRETRPRALLPVPGPAATSASLRRK